MPCAIILPDMLYKEMKKKVGMTIMSVLFGATVGLCQNSFVATGGTATNPQGAVASISIAQPYVSMTDGGLFGMQRNYVMKVSSISTNPISDVSVELDGNVGELDLGEYFTTAGADVLEYSASSSDENVVRVALDGTQLKLTLNQEGSAVVTVMAKNSDGEQSVLSFTVTVEPPQNPTAITEVEQGMAVSVIGKTIVVSNVDGAFVAIYDVSGKCVYSCRNARSVSAAMKLPGTYVVRFGEKRQTVVVQ